LGIPSTSNVYLELSH